MSWNQKSDRKHLSVTEAWILSKDVVLAVQYNKYSKFTLWNKSSHWPTQCSTAKGMGLGQPASKLDFFGDFPQSIKLTIWWQKDAYAYISQ